MTAATLDLLSGGRFLLGLGTSGPQVVEGWHGQPWGKPLDEDARVRRDRPHGPAPRDARAPRRALRHPVLGARRDGPRQAAEADGAPAPRARSRSTSRRWGRSRSSSRRDRGRLDPDLLLAGARARRSSRGRSRARRLRHRAERPGGAGRRRAGGRDALKPYYALYIGGMGARGKNFYNELFARYGYEEEAGRSRISSSTASSARRSLRCRTSSSTRSRSSARRSASPSGWTHSARPARRRCSSQTRDPAALRAVAELTQ